MKENQMKAFGKYIKRSWQYYVLLLPSVVFIAIFAYTPIFGIQIAFRDFRAKRGIWGSEWVGLEHFKRFLSSDVFWPLIRNTLEISIVSMVVGLIVPIVLSLMLNELSRSKLKKVIQMIMYAPHFVSMIAVCGIVTLFTQREAGIINVIIRALGGEGVDFLANPDYFVAIYTISGIWQGAGWGTIIYLAALSSVDPQIVEAAVIDGANRFQKIWYVDIPSIMPTIITMMVLSAGSMLNVGQEKILLLQRPLNISKANVISTYVYNLGIQDGQFSYTTAIGLFNSIVNIIVLTMVNYIAKKKTESSLW